MHPRAHGSDIGLDVAGRIPGAMVRRFLLLDLHWREECVDLALGIVPGLQLAHCLPQITLAGQGVARYWSGGLLLGAA